MPKCRAFNHPGWQRNSHIDSNAMQNNGHNYRNADLRRRGRQTQFRAYSVDFLKEIYILHGTETQACWFGACYPPISNLLIGRNDRLSASSTCGTNGAEQYYPSPGLRLPPKKWPVCHTTNETQDNTTNHRIEHVIHKKIPRTWWQSENGEEMVSIDLKLEQKYRFKSLFITFSSVRPAAMLIERSSDFGRTWNVYRYFAKDCAAAFPDVPLMHRAYDEVFCDESSSHEMPKANGQVKYHLEELNQDNENMFAITNLRINFTKLHYNEEGIFKSKAVSAFRTLVASEIAEDSITFRKSRTMEYLA